MEEKRVIAQSVTMYPEDWIIVDEAGKRVGASRSTTLRRIVREWAQSQRMLDSGADLDTRDRAQIAALGGVPLGGQQ